MSEPLISRITTRRGRPDRRVVQVEFEAGDSLELELPAAAVEDRGLSEGDTLASHVLLEIQQIAEIEACRRRSLRLLATRPRSEEELRRRLVRADFSYLAIERVIGELLENSSLDDDAFAQTLAELRREDRGHAPSRIERELRDRGVDRETAHRAAWAPYERNDMDPESLQLEQALGLLRRKRRRYEGLVLMAARRRMAALLDRSGYPVGVAIDAVDAVLEEMLAEGALSSDAEAEDEGRDSGR
ncbi:regulatory protein RecX [Gemmatimonadota bacterium]